MYKYYKDLKSITFPVYKLPHSDWYSQDGVLFIDGRVLDEKNMPGRTLGVRRLQCGRQDLRRLKNAILNIEGLLNYPGNSAFIDNDGNPFVYVKSKNVPVKYHQVLDIKPRGTHSTVKLRGSIPLFKIPRPPYGEARWAEVLYYNNLPWLILRFTKEKGKDSRKRV